MLANGSLRMIFVLIFQTLSLFALATGNDHGNGGGAVVCRDSEKNLVSADVLDLFEAQFTGQEIFATTENVEKLLLRAVSRFSFNNPLLAQRIRTALKDNSKIVAVIPEGTSLTPPTDAFPWALKDGCHLESAGQFMHLPDQDRLFVDNRILEKMSPIHQAAFWFHEAVYRVLRDSDKDTDSVRARHLVRLAFGTAPIPQAQPDHGSFFNCFAHQSSEEIGSKNFSFSLMGFQENDRFHLWLTRSNSKWIFPAKPLELDNSTNPLFTTKLPLLFQAVGSIEEWKALPEEILTTVMLGVETGPKAITLRMNKSPYSPAKPAYQLQVFLSQSSVANCQMND